MPPPRKRANVVIPPRDLVEAVPRDEMQRILECPICLAVPLPPIFNCVKGHIICSVCRPKMNHCALCRSEYTDSRNFLAEEIVRTCKMACEFSGSGCNSALTGEQLEKHIESCSFRPFRCIFGQKDNCHNASISIRDYENHLFVRHQVERLQLNNENFVGNYRLSDSAKTGCSWNRSLFHEGKAFLVRTLLRDDIFHFTVVFIGSDSEAAKYRVRLRHKKPGSAETKFESIVPAVSIRKSEAEVLENVHCVLPKAVMKHIGQIEPLPGNKEALNWVVEYMLLFN